MPFDPVAVSVLTILGWYSMLRSGIETVYGDINTIQQFYPDIENLCQSLVDVEDQLKCWKILWLIFDSNESEYKAPDELLQWFWGKYFEKIQGDLNLFQTYIKDLIRLVDICEA
jgi:hypothetical protein